jgi:FkbM family methyltransferase
VGRLAGRVFRDRIPSAVGRIDTSHPAVPPEVKARLALRLYERAELRMVHADLRTDLDVVELGASIGVLSRAIARRLAPGRRLVAVEADPDLAPALRANLAEVRDRVAVVTAAVGYDGTTAELHRGPTSTDARVGAPAPTAAATGPSTTVTATTLAALLAEHGVDGPYVLVADIEGAEAELLRHDAAALARCVQLIVELHDTEVDGEPVQWTDLLDQLQHDHGFALDRAHGPVAVLHR